MGLSILIGRTNKDVRGSKINSSMLSRLRKWDSRTQVYTSTDKNLTQAFTQLTRLDLTIDQTPYLPVFTAGAAKKVGVCEFNAPRLMV